MSSIYIIEGAQGSGKTTFSNFLREHMLYTALIRATGIKLGSEKGKKMISRYHLATINYLRLAADAGVNHIVDRSFVSDFVYADLGKKDYVWRDPERQQLHLALKELTNFHKVYFILLTADEETFAKRLKERPGKRLYRGMQFTAKNSIMQQEKYKDCVKTLVSYVPTFTIDTVGKGMEDIFEEFKNKVN